MDGFSDWIIKSLARKEGLSEDEVFSAMKKIYFSDSPGEIIKRLDQVRPDLYQESINLLVIGSKSEFEHHVIFKGYLKDKRDEIKMAALHGLMLCPHPKGKEEVLDVVCNEEEPVFIRRIALDEIGKAFVFPERKKALEKLLSLSEDSSIEIRKALIRALAIIGGEEGIETLKKLANDSEGKVRKMGIRVLKKKDPKKVLGTIEKALEDPDPEVRAEAIRAYSECSYFSPANILKDMMKDPDPGVRETANLALSKYPEEYGKAKKELKNRDHILSAEKVRNMLQSKWLPNGWLEKKREDRIILARDLLDKVRENREIIEERDLKEIQNALEVKDNELLEILAKLLFYAGDYKAEEDLKKLLGREDITKETRRYAKAAIERWITPHSTPENKKVVLVVSDDLELIEALEEVCKKTGVLLRYARPLTPDILVFSANIKVIDRFVLGEENWNLFCDYLEDINDAETAPPDEEIFDKTPLIITDKAGEGEFKELRNEEGYVKNIDGNARELIGKMVEKVLIHSEQTFGGMFAAKDEIEKWEDED